MRAVNETGGPPRLAAVLTLVTAVRSGSSHARPSIALISSREALPISSRIACSLAIASKSSMT